MKRYIILWILVISITLTACGQGAVVYAPTPLPPDTSPIPYQHPSNAFTITMPRTWQVFSQALPDLASASFSLPNSPHPILTVTVMHIGDTTDIAGLLNLYQQEARPDIGRYTELDRQAMGDGSWRLIGLRTTLGGISQNINTFFQTHGILVSISEIILPQPDNPALTRQLEEAVNSLQINIVASLLPTTLFTAQRVATTPLRLTTVHLWTAPNGVKFITGTLQNATDTAISKVPVYAGLQTEDGVVLSGESGEVMGYAIPPGGFMPFSLRFGRGQPVEATHYTLTIGDGQPSASYFGDDTFTITSDRATSSEGNIVVIGDVTHIGTDIVRDPIAILTVYDANRRVIATAFTQIKAGVFIPQENATFSFNITEFGGEPAFHLVTVQALPEIP